MDHEGLNGLSDEFPLSLARLYHVIGQSASMSEALLVACLYRCVLSIKFLASNQAIAFRVDIQSGLQPFQIPWREFDTFGIGAIMLNG